DQIILAFASFKRVAGQEARLDPGIVKHPSGRFQSRFGKIHEIDAKPPRTCQRQTLPSCAAPSFENGAAIRQEPLTMRAKLFAKLDHFHRRIYGESLIVGRPLLLLPSNPFSTFHILWL